MSSIDKEFEIICEVGSIVQIKEYVQDLIVVYFSFSDSFLDEESLLSESFEFSFE